jgi:hypothetical protein
MAIVAFFNERAEHGMDKRDGGAFWWRSVNLYFLVLRLKKMFICHLAQKTLAEYFKTLRTNFSGSSNTPRYSLNSPVTIKKSF